MGAWAGENPRMRTQGISGRIRRRMAVALWLGLAGTATATDYSSTIAAATDFITNRMETDHVPGLAVVLVESQAVVWAQGFGLADLASARPVTTQTVYRIGSISKTFPAVALLQLQEDGLVMMDTPLTNVLADFALQPRDFGLAATNELVVRHLLNYHSGLPGDLMNGGFTLRPFEGYADWLVDYVPETHALYPPDMLYNYCNTGFVLAEEVVARHNTNGLDYADYCQTRIFEPLGMASTSLRKDRAAISSELARVYTWLGDYVELPEQYANMRGAGGAYSSVEDLARYLMMILAEGDSPGGRVLESASLAEMLEPQGTGLVLNVDNRWVPGLGWDAVANVRLAHAPGRLCAKAGSVEEGHGGFIEALPEAQLAAAVIGDMDAMLAWDVCDLMLRHALEDKLGLPVPDPVEPVVSPVASNWPAPALAALTGTYVRAKGYDRVETNGASLLWTLDAGGPAPAAVELWPRSNGWFSTQASQDTEVAFTNLDGRAAMVLRYLWPDGSFIWQFLHAVRHEGTEPPAAWLARTGPMWPLIDAGADDYGWLRVDYQGEPAGLSLQWTNGVFTVRDFQGETHVLEVRDDATAFVAGLTARSDSSVRWMQTNGLAVLQFGGYRYADPAGLPLLEADVPTAGHLTIAGTGAPFRVVPPAPGLRYGVGLVAAPINFLVRVFDVECRAAGIAGVGSTVEVAQVDSGFFALVQAELRAARTGAFEVVVQVPVRMAGAERMPEGLVLEWQGNTNRSYSLLGSPDPRAGFTVATNNLPVTGWRSAWTAAVPAAAGFYTVQGE